MSDIKVADAAGGFIEGAQARADLVNKAVEIQRKRQEMEEKRIELNANKARTIFGEVKKTMLLKGKAREMQIGHVENLARQFDIPFNPIMKEYLNDENNYVDFGQALTTLSEERDPKKIAASLNGISALFTDPATEMPKIAETNAKIRQAKEQARLEAEKRNAPKALDPQETLKLSSATAENIKSAKAAQIETIRAVNSINALASSAESRANPFAQDTAQTLLAKMNDPLTGVRSQEFDRLTGLGVSYFEDTRKALAKAAEGEGKLDDSQWEKIATVANIMGMKAQQSVDSVLNQRSKEISAAGVDPENIRAQLGSYEPLDWKAAGWQTPSYFTKRALVKNETKNKQEQNQAAMNALKDLTPQQRDKLIADRRAKLKAAQVAKGGSNGPTKQTTK